MIIKESLIRGKSVTINEMMELLLTLYKSRDISDDAAESVKYFLSHSEYMKGDNKREFILHLQNLISNQ